MNKPTTNSLRFEVSPIPGENDHQARLMVDGEDWLGPEHLGLDPPHLRAELTSDKVGWTVVGRCTCGCAGCGDLLVNVQREGPFVRWTDARRNDGRSEALTFDARQYETEIKRFAHDHSWENVQRRIERHVDDVFAGAITDDGLRFNWASARTKSKTIALSFFGGRTRQQMMEFGWDGATLESAVTGAKLFFRQQLVSSGPPPVLRLRPGSLQDS